MAFEQQPEALRQRVRQLSTAALAQADPAGWFEPLYQAAQGDTDQIPWAKLAPHPCLRAWLAQHPRLSGSALVVGCGLGDDAEAWQAHGATVTAFDIAPTAIAWCQQRFPASQVTYRVADLLALEAAWRQRFDWVFECRNLQALPLSLRRDAIAAVAVTVAPQGTLLVITRLRPDADADPSGPPWPLSDQDLSQFSDLGFVEVARQPFQEGDAAISQALIEYRQGAV